MLRSERKNGRPLIEDPLFAAHIAQVEIDLWALEITNLRVLSAERGSRAPGPEASILKIRGTEIAQRISELHDARGRTLCAAVSPRSHGSRMAVGSDRASRPDRAMPSTLAAAYMNLRKLSIFGGTNEIQKNIISKMIVGL